MLNLQGSIRGPWATGSDHLRVTGVSCQRGLDQVHGGSTLSVHPNPAAPTTSYHCGELGGLFPDFRGGGRDLEAAPWTPERHP